MACTGDIRSLLGPANYSTIPSNTAVVLEQAWTSHTDILRFQLEKVNEDAMQKVEVLSTINSNLTSKLDMYHEEKERMQIAFQQSKEKVRAN